MQATTYLVHQCMVLLTLFISSIILAYLPLYLLHYFHRRKRKIIKDCDVKLETLERRVNMLEFSGLEAEALLLHLPSLMIEFVRSLDAGLLLAALFLIFIPQLRASFDNFVLAHVNTSKLTLPLEMVQTLNSSVVSTNLTISPVLTKQMESVKRQQDEANYTATHKASPIPLVELILCLSFFALNFMEEFTKMCLKYRKYFWACNSSIVHSSSSERCDFSSLDYRLNKTKRFLITCSRRTFSMSTSNKSSMLHDPEKKEIKTNRCFEGVEDNNSVAMKISHNVGHDDVVRQSKSSSADDNGESNSISSIEFPSYYFNHHKPSKPNVHFPAELSPKSPPPPPSAAAAAEKTEKEAEEEEDDRYNSLYDQDVSLPAKYLDSMSSPATSSQQSTPALFTKMFLPNTTLATCMPARCVCEGIMVAIQPSESMLWLVLSVIIVHKLVIALSVSFELYQQTSGNHKSLPPATVVTFIFLPLLGYLLVMAVYVILTSRQRHAPKANPSPLQLEVAAAQMIFISLSTAALLHFVLIIVQRSHCTPRLQQHTQPHTPIVAPSSSSSSSSASGDCTLSSTTSFSAPLSASTFGFMRTLNHHNSVNPDGNHHHRSCLSSNVNNQQATFTQDWNIIQEIVSNPPRYSVLHLFIMYTGFISILLLLAFINIQV